MNAEDRLRFAIRFARTNLENRRPGDWLNLRDDFNRYLGRKGEGYTLADVGGLLAMSLENPDDISKEQLTEVQAAIKQLFSIFAGGTGSTVAVSLNYSVLKLAGVPVVQVRGNFKDCVVAILVNLLASYPPAPIAICPDCGRLFYRVGKQKFCDRQCTNRAMTRRKRERDKAKETKARAKPRSRKRKQ